MTSSPPNTSTSLFVRRILGFSGRLGIPTCVVGFAAPKHRRLLKVRPDLRYILICALPIHQKAHPTRRCLACQSQDWPFKFDDLDRRPKWGLRIVVNQE